MTSSAGWAPSLAECSRVQHQSRLRRNPIRPAEDLDPTVSSTEGGVDPPISVAATPARSAWWVRMVATLPLGLLYGFSSFVGWLAFRVFPYRGELVHQHLKLAFPDQDEAGLSDIKRRYYAGFAQMFVEIVKSAKMPAAEIE